MASTADEYDVVVIGTGLVESILAAAFARSGKRVLYVDDVRWYGGDSATLSASEFGSVMERSMEIPALAGLHPVQEGYSTINTLNGSSLSCVKCLKTIGDLPTGRDSDFNIDLSPHLVFCRGSCVDILAESGVSRYLEFQTLDSTLYLGPESDAKPVVVPHSKSQVFSSNDITIVEKRQLMRFLQFCMDYNSQENVEWINEKLGASNPGRSLTRPQNKSEDAELKSKALEHADAPIDWLLKDQVRMSDRLCNVVRYAILHQVSSDANVLVKDGMQRIGKYLGALGRFGSTPFLTPMYGVGEICQGFSRLCAVYGGVCALGVRPTTMSNNVIQFAENVESSYIGDRLPPEVKANVACIVSASYLNKSAPLFPGEADYCEVRCVAILSGSIVGETNRRAAFALHPQNGEPLIFGIQLDHSARAAPQGRIVLHLVSRSPSSSSEAIEHVRVTMEERLQALCNSSQVQQIYTAFYEKKVIRHRRESATFVIGDIGSESGHFLQTDLDAAFDHAKHIFQAVLPNDEFLPMSETERQARLQEAQMQAVPDLDE